jgi:hypothetical protein
MSNITLDAHFHETDNQLTATQLTAGAVGTSAAGTISGTASAGDNPTVTIGDCTDRRGSFLLNPVTGLGAQAAGEVALVRFVHGYSKPPIVVLTIENETDGNIAFAGGAADVTELGFDVMTGTVLVTAKSYRIQYHVIQ